MSNPVVVYNPNRNHITLESGEVIDAEKWSLTTYTPEVQKLVGDGKLSVTTINDKREDLNQEVLDLLSTIKIPTRENKSTPRRRKTTKQQNGGELLDTDSASNSSKPSISTERED